MKRRQVLKGIGASGVASLAVGTAAGRGVGDQRVGNRRVTDDDLDVLKVVRDGRVLETFEDPSVADLGRIRSQFDASTELVNQDDCCIAECKSDCCPNQCCMYGGDC